MKRETYLSLFLLDLLVILATFARTAAGEPAATRGADPDLVARWGAASVNDGVLKDLAGKIRNIKSVVKAESAGDRKAIRVGKDHAPVEVGADDGFDFTSDYTIALWVRLTGDQQDVTMLSKRAVDGDGNARGYALMHGIRGIGGVGFVSAPDIIIPTPCKANDTWTHVAVTFREKTLLLYVDGKAIGIREVESLPVAAKAPLVIGSGLGGKAMEGWLDEIRIYRRGLSAAEVKQLASNEEPTNPYTVLSKEEEKEVRALVAQLGSGKFAIREAAIKTLREKGRKIFPVLKEYRDAEDLEIASRIKLLLGELPQGDQ